MKHFYTLLVLTLALAAKAQFTCQETRMQQVPAALQNINNNGKSDTVNILHYHLDLDFTTLPTLSGKATIAAVPLQNGVNHLVLDLLRFTVDTVLVNGLPVATSYNDTLLHLWPTTSWNTTDTLEIAVHYHGVPPVDGSGWGGFHQSGPYAFVLGVGFAADPHTYGRSWHPCFDNFKEKATYSYVLTSPANRIATANGSLDSAWTLGGLNKVRYTLHTPISAYLACVAQADYTKLSGSAVLQNGTVPLEIFARPADTTNAKASLQNVEAIAQAFEASFGPYMWERIGYVLTTIGAMEHATSIHYPRNLANGTLAYEEIVAHELAHHWWGNWVTCATAEDMWINEGMAEFSSHLYRESLYGRTDYINTIKANLQHVLRQAHVADNGFRAIAGVPHAYTYGEHVYQKGALVGHNLRGYLGDSAFFGGMQYLMAQHAQGNLSTAQFQTSLETYVGSSLTDFFTDWVNSPGFADFYADSLTATPVAGGMQVFFRIKQGQYGNAGVHHNVPLELTFVGATGETATLNFTAQEASTSGQTTLAFAPKHLLVNRNNTLLLGCLASDKWVKQTGPSGLPYGDASLVVNQVTDSAWVCVEHHFAQPGEAAGYRLSPNHFWSIKTLNAQPTDLTAQLPYDGRQTAGFLDLPLLTTYEDSILLLYRSTPTSPWSEYPHYQKNIQGSTINKAGRMELSQVWEGDYALANGVSLLGVVEMPREAVRAYPNPAKDYLVLNLPKDFSATEVILSDTTGRIALRMPITQEHPIRIPVQNLKPGTYLLQVGSSSMLVQVAQ